jgi:hypothetical protein
MHPIQFWSPTDLLGLIQLATEYVTGLDDWSGMKFINIPSLHNITVSAYLMYIAEQLMLITVPRDTTSCRDTSWSVLNI